MRKLLLLAALALPLSAATQLGSCQSVTGGTQCSTGYNSTGAKVTWAVVTSTTNAANGCPTASPATTFTAFTTWTSSANAAITLCRSLSPTNGNPQTFTKAASTEIYVFSYDTFSGAIEAASDLGGCFYTGCANGNVTSFSPSAFTPSATGDLIFACVFEGAASDGSLALTTNHNANFTGGAMSTAGLLTGGGVIILCKWGEYNSTTAVTLTGTINNTFNSAIGMGAVQAASTSRRKNGGVI